MLKSIILLFGVLFIECAISQGDNAIKRGIYPYMAFIYYPDDSVVDKNGDRVTRAGILVKLDWLITSSLETELPMAFPQKTLVARLGSIAIDTKFNINEDEDEQEREVIQIIRPHNFSAIEWWYSDISLLKTLLPFNTSMSVAITPISPKPQFSHKDCYILVFAKKNSNAVEDRILTQIQVDIVPPSAENCGSHYRPNTMICGLDIDDKKNVSYSSNYCQGNSGGPLICEKDVYGLQTYSQGCQEPHLYQLFSGWTDFISCGIQDICEEHQCANVCTLINKDTEKYNENSLTTTESEKVHKKEPTTLVASKLLEADENNNVVEEISSYRPTITTIRNDDVTTTTHSTSMSVQSTTNTSSSGHTEVTNDDVENARRSNVEAQLEAVKKVKSSGSIATPVSICSFAFIWSVLHFI